MPQTTPNVHQIVESAYGWANGDVPKGQLVDLDDLSTPDYQGDGLIEFILRETAPEEGMEENDGDHIQLAITRMQQVHREVASILEALESASMGS